MVKRWTRRLAKISVTRPPSLDNATILTIEQVLENRAEKHLAESDMVLLTAIMRIWKAHKNGRLLEQIRSSRLKAIALKQWNVKIGICRANEGGFQNQSLFASSLIRSLCQYLLKSIQLGLVLSLRQTQ